MLQKTFLTHWVSNLPEQGRSTDPTRSVSQELFFLASVASYQQSRSQAHPSHGKGCRHLRNFYSDAFSKEF